MKIFVVCLGTSFLISLMACTEPVSQPKIVPVDEKKNNSTVELTVGDRIEISLPGNPTTGYEWKLRAVDKEILEPLGELEYKPNDEALGAGGRYTLRLKAIATGETRVEIVYRRPFDTLEVPSLDVYSIFVVVR